MDTPELERGTPMEQGWGSSEGRGVPGDSQLSKEHRDTDVVSLPCFISTRHLLLTQQLWKARRSP